ncbi:hypothetical protein BpHYR1_030967 [Brachionus plicatilis]|uniref:Uncharacterized protein n=1 Tax=Brachionus plicatilis TaxID=10195 RepID=A0A3M7SVZ1_BRAPC|nr:hypothetical protein BpHYR1_030967 [Brachionus plicatilis]
MFEFFFSNARIIQKCPNNFRHYKSPIKKADKKTQNLIIGTIISECLKQLHALIALRLKIDFELSMHLISYLILTNLYGLQAQQDLFFIFVLVIICSFDLQNPLHAVVLNVIRPHLSKLRETSIVSKLQ